MIECVKIECQVINSCRPLMLMYLTYMYIVLNDMVVSSLSHIISKLSVTHNILARCHHQHSL